MGILWFAISISIAVSALAIFRNSFFKKWLLPAPNECAMEFDAFPVKPHPMYPKMSALYLAMTLFIISAGLYYAIENLAPSAIVVSVGMIIYFYWDFSGAAVRANLTVLPDGVYIESTKECKLPFFVPFTNIKKVVQTVPGFIIILSPSKFINRIPFSCKRAEEAIAAIEKGLKK
jgi:hypothetical protein